MTNPNPRPHGLNPDWQYIVLAPSFQAFAEWRRAHNITWGDALYMADVDSLQGRRRPRNLTVVRLSNWEQIENNHILSDIIDRFMQTDPNPLSNDEMTN